MAGFPSPRLSGPPSSRRSALGPTASGEAGALAVRLAGEMAERWRRGEQPPAEEYLTRHPPLREQPEAALLLIYEEICLRQELGQEVTPGELVSRFPHWQAQLEVLFDCHRLLQLGRSAPVFPEVGESLADFHVLAELGRGAEGRAFLATQPSLARRPVVLKVTSRHGLEHLRLARLQHSHIVPLYSVQEDAARNRRLLCMPYYGGLSLAELLERLESKPVSQRTGQDLLEALALARLASPVDLPAKGPAFQFLARASYVQALCWMGACLADALHYAHERGVVHLDLKPSNVLLAADGQPMLLDFHLAQEPLGAGGPSPAWLGGSYSYMPREQRAALAAVREGRPVPEDVDGRADLFALGALLYQALGGHLPYHDGVSPRLDRCNPHVSMGLADLIHRCLAPEAAARYPDARALAVDLRRHLANLPLRGVANRSAGERWRKWRRRRPYTLGLAGMLLAVLGTALTGASLVLVHARQQFGEASLALEDGREQLHRREYALAERTLVRGRSLVAGWPRSAELRQALDTLLGRVRRAQAAQQLHVLTDEVRFLYAAESLSETEQRRLEACCGQVWHLRHRFTDPPDADAEPELEQRLRTDLLDLGIIWADLQVRLASPGEVAAARRRALGLLAEVQEQFGPSPALDLQRHLLTAEQEDGDLTRAVLAGEVARPQTAWEHHALGRYFLRCGNVERAAVELERAVELQPQGFWFHFYRGVCAYRLRQYEKAVYVFEVCLALAPESAVCYFNRALAQAARGEVELALRDYNRALQMDPGLAAAALNRGVLLYQAGRPAEAQADLELALCEGAPPAKVHYHLALVYLAQKDRAAALDSLRQVLQHEPGHAPAHALLARVQKER
jgi:serine/threonine protein kinase/Tfp pilus assembly protein PilF